VAGRGVYLHTLGPLKASANPFLNNRAFELGKNPEHLKHGLARRRSRIETLLMQKEIDAERVKLGEARHNETAAQAVDASYLCYSLCDAFHCADPALR
jgi:hypothetical protein